jgi:ubiquitin-like 1-activating enzyme E1 A
LLRIWSLDPAVVTAEDVGGQFFLSENQIGEKRALAVGSQIRNMDPRVQLHVDVEDVRKKPPEFFAGFDVIIATDLDFQTYTIINKACRMVNCPFYAAALHGFYGYVFVDLVSHDFAIEREKSNIAPPQETSTGTILNITTKKEIDNVSLLLDEFTRTTHIQKEAVPLLIYLQTLWEFQKRFDRLPNSSGSDLDVFNSLIKERYFDLDQVTPDAELLFSFLYSLRKELSPVAAFVGSCVSQDVVDALSGRKPVVDVKLFDTSISKIYPLQLTPPEKRQMTVELMRSLYPKNVVERAMFERGYEYERGKTISELRQQIEKGLNVKTCKAALKTILENTPPMPPIDPEYPSNLSTDALWRIRVLRYCLVSVCSDGDLVNLNAICRAYVEGILEPNDMVTVWYAGR